MSLVWTHGLLGASALSTPGCDNGGTRETDTGLGWELREGKGTPISVDSLQAADLVDSMLRDSHRKHPRPP